MSLIRRTPLLAAAATALTALIVSAPVSDAKPGPTARVAALAWGDAAPVVGEGTALTLRVTLSPGAETEVRIRVAGGTVDGLPDACAPSTVVRRRSYLSGDAT